MRDSISGTIGAHEAAIRACFGRLADLIGGAGHAAGPNGVGCDRRTRPDHPELAGATRVGTARGRGPKLPGDKRNLEKIRLWPRR